VRVVLGKAVPEIERQALIQKDLHAIFASRESFLPAFFLFYCQQGIPEAGGANDDRHLEREVTTPRAFVRIEQDISPIGT